MYSESEIESAVIAGAITPAAAQALRNHVTSMRASPVADEEQFRLITGFNDIFVVIAAVILLIAMGSIGGTIHPALGALMVAGTAWGLSEFFTRQRRMALPSIILLLAFVGGVAGTGIGILAEHGEAWFGFDPDDRIIALLGTGIALATAGAAWLHWRRFMVPITIAAGTAALVATGIGLILAAIGNNDLIEDAILPLLLVAGLLVFGFAMRWDMSDTARQTRRSDVAFWLHLLAAPLIAHPLFSLLGVTEGDSITLLAAGGVIAIYVLLGLVALVVDRRALLVSALAYVLFALTNLFRQFGVVELNVALTALVIGSALLLLSAFWAPIRGKLIRSLPENWRGIVPQARIAAAA